MAPRAGLDRAAVVDAAAALVDREGAQALSLSRLARGFGVKTPSLYSHVGGLDALRRELRLRGLRDLAAVLERAAAGRSGGEALRELARAYRGYASAHPGLYALIQQADPGDEELREATGRLVGLVLAILRGYGLEGDEALHAARCLRAALHGFVALEAGSGFGMPLAVEESFARLTELLHSGLQRASAEGPSG